MPIPRKLFVYFVMAASSAPVAAGTVMRFHGSWRMKAYRGLTLRNVSTRSRRSLTMANSQHTTKPVFEAHGKNDDGSLFSVEVIGGLETPMTEPQAIEIAREYAKRWAKAADLYEVPYVNLSSTSFADSEMRFIIRLDP